MARLSVFVFVDALGWEIVQKHNPCPFLTSRSPCDTVFGYSSTCDPTILTGCLPKDHGHFSFFVDAGHSGTSSPFSGISRALGWMPDSVGGYHRVRNRVSRLLGDRLGYTGYFNLYSVPFRCLRHLDYTEKRDLYQPGGIIGGRETVFDHWRRSGKDWHCSNWRRGDDENYQTLMKQVDVGRISSAYLFVGGLDGLMHAHGTRDNRVRLWLKDFEQRLANLMKLAKNRYDCCHLSVLSDHGMADTRHTSDLMVRWNKHGSLRYGVDYVAVWDSTMARFWFRSDRARREISGFLDGAGDGRIVSDEELDSWGCLFPDRKYGECFYLLPSGTIFAPSFMNRRLVKGMHGYDPNHKDSTACWLTNAPETGVPKSLCQIAPIMKAACEDR